jgi:RNA polymerase sigma factor (sigma-70 family)
MQSKASTPKEYLDSLPADKKRAVGELRKEILKNLPKGFSEEMSYGMLGYVVPHSVYPDGYHCDTDTHKVVLNRELNHIIENSLAQIPLEYRMVFSLREINGMNVSETAYALETSESNVKVRLNRAKSMLRKEIEKKYNAEEIFEFNLIYCDAMVDRVMNKIKNRHIKPEVL